MNEPVLPGPGFYTTDAFTEHAMQFIRESTTEDNEQPFFLYLAYNAPHWPLHAKSDDLAKYEGKYRGICPRIWQDRLISREGANEVHYKLDTEKKVAHCLLSSIHE